MRLEKEIENLKEMLLKMSDTVVENISEAILVYVGKKEASIINDDLVDQYERLIEEICLTILLRERPYASDLKQVTGILKLVADVERIGDHAEDIMQFATKLNQFPSEHMEAVDKLTSFVLEMLKKSILSYVNSDVELANQVIKSDDYVDEKYEEIVEMLAHPQKEGENYLPFAIYTTLMVKYLERIADHCVNIAEWVVYIVSGYHKDKKIY